MQVPVLLELLGTTTRFHKKRGYFEFLLIHIAATETGLKKVELSTLELHLKYVNYSCSLLDSCRLMQKDPEHAELDLTSIVRAILIRDEDRLL
jgi:hypothetical protein